MKMIVILLALLAGAKFSAEEYVYRQATRDLIVDAYKARAMEACRRDPRNAEIGVTALGWLKPTQIELVIGRRSLDVGWWQIDHALWRDRFRNAVLIVIGPDASRPAVCEYDVLRGSAAIARA